MLFITKGGVRKEVVKATKPMLHMAEMTGGLPAGFWTDPIILGFLWGTMNGLVAVIGNQKYSSAEASEISMGAVDDLRGPGLGLATATKAVQLMQAKDPAFEQALKGGYLSVLVAMHGPSKVLDEPIVQAAIRHAAKLPEMSSITGPLSEAASISSALSDMFFQKRIWELRRAD